ncbi:hypothetical protein PG996_011011 [Apiospora saccharicola]|uniref:Uncharacterized protein n=1 Tax=Apiospora saccharicola TaxID=335842 RepID=A0ABR1UDU9_9PEZI
MDIQHPPSRNIVGSECPRLRVRWARYRGQGQLPRAVRTRVPGGDANDRTHVAHWPASVVEREDWLPTEIHCHQRRRTGRWSSWSQEALALPVRQQKHRGGCIRGGKRAGRLAIRLESPERQEIIGAGGLLCGYGASGLTIPMASGNPTLGWLVGRERPSPGKSSDSDNRKGRERQFYVSSPLLARPGDPGRVLEESQRRSRRPDGTGAATGDLGLLAPEAHAAICYYRPPWQAKAKEQKTT